jgi:hypothetical protein
MDERMNAMRSWLPIAFTLFSGFLLVASSSAQEYGRTIIIDGVNDFDDPTTEEIDEYLLAIDDGHDPATEELAPIWEEWNNGIGDAAIEDHWNYWIGPNDDYSANPMEMGPLYVTNDMIYLYVGLMHTDTDGKPLPGGFGYWNTQVGAVIDVNRTPSGGNQNDTSPTGFIDPWSNNEEFFHEHRPDYIAWFDHRSNVFSLYHWDVEDQWWNEITQDSVDGSYSEFNPGSLTIFGNDGIPNRDQGPYSGPDKFVEFQIPLRALGIDYDAIYGKTQTACEPPVVSLEAWCTQPGRGAYDTVPTDNQLSHYPSMGDWSGAGDKTDLSQYADYLLKESPDTVRPQIVGALAVDRTQVDVLFSEAMDSSSAADVDHYDISTLEVTAVEMAFVNTARLVTEAQTSGVSCTLTVESKLTDLTGNEMDPAHNIAVFTGFSTDVLPQERAAAILPGRFDLLSNYPNPFNPKTTIGYRLNLVEPMPVSLRVHNILGQRVCTLVRAVQGSGTYQVTWDGRDDAGAPLASGIYLLRLQVGEQGETRKLVLAK